MIAVDIQKRLGTFALDMRFEVDHETVVLFGRSGSGKSVTLASLAGLVRPDEGTLTIGGRVVFDAARGIDVPPQARNVGYLVQQLALFPHMTADENIAHGLVGWSREARMRRVSELKELLSLDGLGGRRPHQLSGGQQQRIALARSLARPVDALLLDEPFSALDEALRGDLRAEISRLQRELDIPVVFVTHDLREAHLLADRIAVLDAGHALQFAPREEIFRRPASRRVAELTGVRNIFAGTADGTGHVEVSGARFRTDIDVSTPGPVDVCIRAERCLLRRLDPAAALPDNCFTAEVTSDLAFGNAHTLRLTPVGAGPQVEIEVASHPYDVLGIASQRLWVVELPADDLHLMS